MLGNIGLPQLVIVLVIIILIFGTKRLKSLGSDVGSAIKNFKKAVDEGEQEPLKNTPKEPESIDNKSNDANFSELKQPHNEDHKS